MKAFRMLTVPPNPRLNRELVLDPLGDVAVEEDSLAGQEEAAIARNLVALPPDPCVDLRLEVHSKLKLFVLGLPLKARAERARQRHSLGACEVSQRVSRRGRVGDELALGVVGYGSVGVARPSVVARRSHRSQRRRG